MSVTPSMATPPAFYTAAPVTKDPIKVLRFPLQTTQFSLESAKSQLQKKKSTN